MPDGSAALPLRYRFVTRAMRFVVSKRFLGFCRNSQRGLCGAEQRDREDGNPIARDRFREVSCVSCWYREHVRNGREGVSIAV